MPFQSLVCRVRRQWARIPWPSTQNMGSNSQRAVVDLQEGRPRSRPRVDLPVQASSFVGRERELDELEGMLASRQVADAHRSRRLRARRGSRCKLPPTWRKTSRTASVSSSWPPSPAPSSWPRARRGPLGCAGRRAFAGRGAAGPSGAQRDAPAAGQLRAPHRSVRGAGDALLRSCPGLKVLATSREALSVPGERAWLVPSLSLPDAREETGSRATDAP